MSSDRFSLLWDSRCPSGISPTPSARRYSTDNYRFDKTDPYSKTNDNATRHPPTPKRFSNEFDDYIRSLGSFYSNYWSLD